MQSWSDGLLAKCTCYPTGRRRKVTLMGCLLTTIQALWYGCFGVTGLYQSSCLQQLLKPLSLSKSGSDSVSKLLVCKMNWWLLSAPVHLTPLSLISCHHFCLKPYLLFFFSFLFVLLFMIFSLLYLYLKGDFRLSH